MYIPVKPSSQRQDSVDLFYLSIIGSFAVISLIYFVLISRYSGSAQWVIVLVLVAISALVALRLTKKGLKKEYPLQEPVLEKSGGNGDLGEFRKALERADSGLTYSQLIVKERFIKVLLDRIRIENGLSQEEVKALRGDTERLRGYVRDPVLLRYSNSCIMELDNWNESINKKGEREFLRNLDDMVKKMEV